MYNSKSESTHIDEVYSKRVIGRIKAGKKHTEQFHQKSKRNASRYLSNQDNPFPTAKDIDVLRLGDVNYVASNIRIKTANMTTGEIDFEVECDNVDAIPVVREYIKKSWYKHQWNRVVRQVATSRFVAGVGIAAYAWTDDAGFVIEYIQPEDYIFDPNTPFYDMDNPKWCAKKVRIPYDDAVDRYGDIVVQCVGHKDTYNTEYKEYPIDIWVYYDKEYEIELYEGHDKNEVLKVSPNLYQRVPIKILQGDINPKGGFPLSDYDLCLASSEMLNRQQHLINTISLKGGGKEWIRTDFIADEKVRERVIENTHEGVIPIQGVPGSDVMGVTIPQQVNETTLLVMDMLKNAIDIEQGVQEAERGVIESNPKFASQVALMASRSGVRTTQLRQEIERYVEDLMGEFLALSVLFGLNGTDVSEKDVLLWEALTSTTDIKLVPESLMTENRQLKQQEFMQIFNLALQGFDVMNLLGFAPNLKKLFDDVIRNTDRAKDIDSYYLPSGGLIGEQRN